MFYIKVFPSVLRQICSPFPQMSLLFSIQTILSAPRRAETLRVGKGDNDHTQR